VKPSAAHDAPSSGLAALPVLGRLFDAGRSRAALDAAPVAGALSAGVTPLSAASDAPRFIRVKAPNDAPPAPPSGPIEPAGPSGPNGPADGGAPRKLPVGLGLLLAVGGGVGAWYAAPVLLPFLSYALAHIPYFHPALSLLASKSVLAGLGAAAGLSIYSTRTWLGFPAALKSTAVTAAVSTFRFWGRFGMIFDAVIRGKSTDEATKAALPGNLFKYPVVAWPFVALGYLFTPVAFVLGAAWRLVGTPLLAAWRGAVDVAVGFFPWLSKVFRFLRDVLKNLLPFAGGLLWGAVRGVFYAAAAGAVILAGPVVRDVVIAEYEPKTVPGWAALRLLQLGGLVATLGLGAVGAAAGVLVSPLHALLSSLRMAFKWSGASAKADGFFSRAEGALNEDKGFDALLGRNSKSEGPETLAARGSRLVNGSLSGLLLVPAFPFVALATLVRALYAPSRGVDAARTSSDWDAQTPLAGAERPVALTAGFVLPATLGLIGAAAGVAAYGFLAPAFLVFGGLAGLAMWGLAAVIGGGLGLALSQPAALKTVPGAVSADAVRAGGIGWTVWTDAGRRLVAAVTGTDKAAPLGTVLGALPGAPMTLVSGALGAAHGLLGTTAKAGWNGFVESVRRFIPALKRFLNAVKNVLKNIIPFVFGFLFGAIGGLFKTAFPAVAFVFYPAAQAFSAEDRQRAEPSEAQIGFGLLLGIAMLPLAAGVLALSLAAGAVLGLPLTLAYGLSKAVRWSKPSERSVAYFEAWEETALPRAYEEMLRSVSGVYQGAGRETTVWRLTVRVASTLLAAPVTLLTLAATGLKAYVRSFRDARILADGGRLPDAARRIPDGGDAPETTPLVYVPAAKTPVMLAAASGLVGLAAGLGAMWFLGLPWLAGLAGWTLWAGYAAVFAGLPLLGLATGLALTQAGFWTNLLPLGKTHAAAGMRNSYETWKGLGDAALEGVFGVARGSKLTALHRLAGGVLGLGWALAGAVYGAGAAFFVAAYEGARQVVYEMLPALRVAFETAMKVIRRIVPFFFGFAAGVVAGVVGSAAFGALLLGRPYFQHVVAQDFENEGFVAMLGNALLKLVALVLGVLFGVGGLAIGIVVAAPYALTSSVALAFRWGGIGGPVQRFFDHWTFGALREEMRRINQLTARFQFEDAAPGRDPSLAAGWIRMANVFPATLAAIFAAGIAGVVSYFRSLRNAYRSAKAGEAIPTPTVDEESRREWDRTWSRAGRTASGFWWWGILGAVVGGAVALMSSWTPLGLAGWLLVGAAAGFGVFAALVVGAVIAMVALMWWIGGQLR
jgi:hypothetical protein